MRRILLEVTTGRYAGLRMIVGTDEGFEQAAYPLGFPAVELLPGHTAPVRLADITPKWALYREQAVPSTEVA